jgi:sugar phosphate isomerase/epimerase
MLWAFMTANYVGRALGYRDGHDWSTYHQATVEAFHGAGFESKFEELVAGIKSNGFDALELWVAHLDPHSATDHMVGLARAILDRYELPAISYTAGFGRPGVTREEAIRVFETARAIGAPVLAQGFHPANGPLVRELAEQYGIRMGLENHPEKTPGEVIAKVAPYAPWIGAAMDTGWFATQGYDAVQATRDLRDHLVHVHLKDVTAPGSHDSCTLGDGVVDCRGILAVLHAMGWQPPITLEHEPYDHDPMPDCVESLRRARAWWAELNATGT